MKAGHSDRQLGPGSHNHLLAWVSRSRESLTCDNSGRVLSRDLQLKGPKVGLIPGGGGGVGGKTPGGGEPHEETPHGKQFPTASPRYVPPPLPFLL